MFHWIQVTLAESHDIEEKGLVPKDSGYKYRDAASVDMVEYHVVSCHLFQDRMNKEMEFGGCLSVHLEKNEMPLKIFGHDECIFKQYTLTKRYGLAQMVKLFLYQKMMDKE